MAPTLFRSLTVTGIEMVSPTQVVTLLAVVTMGFVIRSVRLTNESQPLAPVPQTTW